MWYGKPKYYGFYFALFGLRPIGGPGTFAYDLNLQSKDSILSVSEQLTNDMVLFYNGAVPGQVPGLLPEPYYWWEGGAFLGTLIDYWYYTGNTAHNGIVMQGMLHQAGDTADFMPPNQTLTEGNDDQGFWGMAVMSAAEHGFENPPSDQPQWLALAQAVFNTQAARWDRSSCAGGLRWQIFEWNIGYDYKNSISQGCFFNLAARLALYTGNVSYADWAIRTWEWMEEVRFIDEEFRVYDGAHIGDNCTTIVPYEFSYNVGVFLLGAAAMYEFSNVYQRPEDKTTWERRVDGLLNSTENIFFYASPQPSNATMSTSPDAASATATATSTTSAQNKVMFEIACEPYDLCNVDQRSFKAYLARWMAATTKWCPWTLNRTRALLSSTAKAATRQCTGGDNGRMCGLKWANNPDGVWDGTTGVGEQMAVLEVVLAAGLIGDVERPKTHDHGGTSPGDPGAGGAGIGHNKNGGPKDHNSPEFKTWWLRTRPLTRADKAGGTLVTIALLTGLMAGAAAMIADENKSIGENWRILAQIVQQRRWPESEKGSGNKGDGIGSGTTAEETGTASATTLGPTPVDGGGKSGGSGKVGTSSRGGEDGGRNDDVVANEEEAAGGSFSSGHHGKTPNSTSSNDAAQPRRGKKSVTFADIPTAPAAAVVMGRRLTKRLSRRSTPDASDSSSSTHNDSQNHKNQKKRSRWGKEASVPDDLAPGDVELRELGERKGGGVESRAYESTADLIATASEAPPQDSKRLQAKRYRKGNGGTS